MTSKLGGKFQSNPPVTFCESLLTNLAEVTNDLVVILS